MPGTHTPAIVEILSSLGDTDSEKCVNIGVIYIDIFKSTEIMTSMLV